MKIQFRHNSDFAVGFSRQPLPKGNCFAVVTNIAGSRIKATDAAGSAGLVLTTLRPETNESVEAKLPPTAIVISPARRRGPISMTERARVGFRKITNGVKQRAPSSRLLGMGSCP